MSSMNVNADRDTWCLQSIYLEVLNELLCWILCTTMTEITFTRRKIYLNQVTDS